jgi:hypothetical protein
VYGPWDLQLGDLCKGAQISPYAVAPALLHHQRWTGHAVPTGDGLHGELHGGERGQKFTHNAVRSKT